MVITFDLVELPLCLPQSSLYGQKGHRVVGLDAAKGHSRTALHVPSDDPFPK